MSQIEVFSPLKKMLILLVMILISSCNNNRKLNLALEMAGANKVELKSVVDHFNNQPQDSLELKVAKFLVENMPYHYSYDTTFLCRYRPVIYNMAKLRDTTTVLDIIRKVINPQLDSIVSLYPLSRIYSNVENDLSVLGSDFLIGEINLALSTYNQCKYKDVITFNDFVEYVSPYRVEDGLSIQDWRTYFLDQHYDKISLDSLTIFQFCDSLLFKYRDIEMAWEVAHKYPYLRFEDVATSKLVHCPQKCWLNCMLLRSYGIPLTIDYVPVSRVHTFGHQWNTILTKDGIFPIEPFWTKGFESDNLKAYYCREMDHPELGPIQFPKVYRKIYRFNITDLQKYALEMGKEIPSGLRNPFVEDVTSQYFKVWDISFPLARKLDDENYIYACIVGNKQNWVPVTYGKVEDENFRIQSLGAKNVYLPAYYKNGNIIPASNPVLINNEGTSSLLNPDMENTRSVKVSNVAYPRPSYHDLEQSFVGCTIEGANKSDFEDREIICKLDGKLVSGNNEIPVISKKSFRYWRFKLSNYNTRINEVRFYRSDKGVQQEVRGDFISGLKGNRQWDYVNTCDNNNSTYIDFIYSQQNFNDGKTWVGNDFTNRVSLSKIELYFTLPSEIRIEETYELMYWNFGWKSLGKRKSNANFITFDNVPKNALLMIKISKGDNYSRPFTYSGGKQHWW